MGTTRKPEQRGEARRLRAEHGMPLKQIAARLNVSPSSVVRWTTDIELTEEQWQRNRHRERSNRESFARRAARWAEISRERRRAWQMEGRARARRRDPLHQAGCMLYWAEGTKSRNVLTFANSDAQMLQFFSRFLRQSLGVQPDDFRVRLNFYTGNALSIADIEDYWLEALDLPRSCLRGHSINHFPTSSSGGKRNLPCGVCTVKIARSTRLVQHIFGAIQEYGGFEEPSWLDCLPGKRRVGQPSAQE
jgi:transcriptional regulator with XRE-family HTH domain